MQIQSIWMAHIQGQGRMDVCSERLKGMVLCGEPLWMNQTAPVIKEAPSSSSQQTEIQFTVLG